MTHLGKRPPDSNGARLRLSERFQGELHRHVFSNTVEEIRYTDSVKYASFCYSYLIRNVASVCIGDKTIHRLDDLTRKCCVMLPIR